jgi:FkbM family methyltransferase
MSLQQSRGSVPLSLPLGLAADQLAPLQFDRRSGAITGASTAQKMLIYLLGAGVRLSAGWSYRGFGTLCRLLRRLLPPRLITVRLNDDALLCFPFADSYWSALLDPGFVYEDDIEILLRASAAIDYTFLDCGANCGYWSVLVSSTPFGAKRAIAFEPSSHSFHLLSQNALINRTGFQCRKSALGGMAGVARLTGCKHESMTIAAEPGGAPGEWVPVIALDGMIDEGLVAPHDRCIIKLDVEGLEIESLQGGRRMLSGDCVVICEDHGGDRDHTVSRHILTQTAMKLFCFDPVTRRYEQLTDASALDRIKRFSNRGYNVLATSSAFWEQVIRAATP